MLGRKLPPSVLVGFLRALHLSLVSIVVPEVLLLGVLLDAALVEPMSLSSRSCHLICEQVIYFRRQMSVWSPQASHELMLTCSRKRVKWQQTFDDVEERS